MYKTFLTTLLIFILNITTKAQESKPVESIDGIVNEVLQLVSGDSSRTKDWEEFKNLFLPTAQFTILYHNDRVSKKVETLSLNDFVKLAGAQYQSNGFMEYEIDKRIDEYNGIAQVFQTYYAKDFKSGYEEKGVNSYQLVYDKKRWWIASILWTSDENGIEIPRFNK